MDVRSRVWSWWVIAAPRPRMPHLRLVAGVLLGAGVLVVGAWLAWSILRPLPAGFAPTTDASALAHGDVRQHTIDATDAGRWAYFDLSRGEVVVPEDVAWDLAFRRTAVMTNGGATNLGGFVGAVDLGKIPLEEAIAPAAGYESDAATDGGGTENPALRKWYSYSLVSHVVSTRKHVYAVRDADGHFFLLTFLSYYCQDGSPGCVTIRYKRQD